MTTPTIPLTHPLAPLAPLAEVAPAVRWEPCPEFDDGAAADLAGVCAGCGWPADDHGLPVAA
jgi:hypothetical protein